MMKTWKVLFTLLVVTAIATFALTILLYLEYQSLLPYLNLKSYPWFVEVRIAQIVNLLIIISIVTIALLTIATIILLKEKS